MRQKAGAGLVPILPEPSANFTIRFSPLPELLRTLRTSDARSVHRRRSRSGHPGQLGPKTSRNLQARDGPFPDVRRRYSEEQIELFGDVLERLIKTIEIRALADVSAHIALAEMSSQLASVKQAPRP